MSERERLLTTGYERWPELAAQWLRAGYDSAALRDFAALTPAEGALLADHMSDVLASLGVPVRAGVPITGQLSLITDFEPRCRRLLDIVAADVTRTWGQLDLGLHLHIEETLPTVIVTVTVAGYHRADSDTTMTLWMPPDELLIAAASGVRESLLVNFGVKWPLCTAHRARVTPSPPSNTDDAHHHPLTSWWCPAEGGHLIAAIGELPASAVQAPDRPALDIRP